jgi:hypothetical protein
MAESESTDALPWYRHFWPWFIIGLLAAAVSASIATVVIAFANQDSLVSENWYESGEQINRRLESNQNAARRAIRAELSVDDLTGEVRVDLAGLGVGGVAQLMLTLSHPTQASRDRSIELVRAESGLFRGSLDAQLRGRWYASLAPEATTPRGAAEPSGASSTAHSPATPSTQWRLDATLRFPSSEPLVMDGSG